MTLLAGFSERRIAVDGVTINAAIGGAGPPLLLIHGYPQTHAMWHKLAPALAERFTVVAADLRGYGDSGKPVSAADYSTYAKRTMANDLVGVMAALGHARFAVAGHDRGGRVGYRMALDHPACVERLAVLDIVPTKTLYDATDRIIATHYFHWFLLVQPAPFPETLIGADPRFWLDTIFTAWSARPAAFTAQARAEYHRCFTLDAVRASTDDYRAGAGIDCTHDAEALAAGQTIACPVLALWGRHGVVGRRFDAIAEWRRYAGDVGGQALDCGHFLPEEAPEATLAALLEFLA